MSRLMLIITVILAAILIVMVGIAAMYYAEPTNAEERDDFTNGTSDSVWGDYTYVDYNLFDTEVGANVTRAVLTGYIGKGGAVTLPTEIEGKAVVEVKNYAFANNTNITSLTITNDDITLKAYAFHKASGLKSLTITSSEKLATSGNAFQGCAALESVAITGQTVALGGNDFRNCTSLKSVTISASGSAIIGTSAFQGCAALSEVKFGSGDVNVTTNSFQGVAKLITLEFQGNAVFMADWISHDESYVITVRYHAGATGFVFDGYSNIFAETF